MRNMMFKVIDRLFLVVFSHDAPTDDEWGSYLDAVELHGVDRTMQLIYTDGGEPTGVQRDRLNRLLAGRNVPVAIVTSSAMVRLTVTALSWFNRQIRAFPPDELRDAVAYLEIPSSRAELIRREVESMRTRLLDDRRATA